VYLLYFTIYILDILLPETETVLACRDWDRDYDEVYRKVCLCDHCERSERANLIKPFIIDHLSLVGFQVCNTLDTSSSFSHVCVCW